MRLITRAGLALGLAAALPALAADPAPAQPTPTGPAEPAAGATAGAGAAAKPPDAKPEPKQAGKGPTVPPQRANPAVVLEEVNGTVASIDRVHHALRITTPGGEVVALSMDRNTLVYTTRGLGTVLDVEPGAMVRAGRNAAFLAYWVQVRAGGGPEPVSTPAQGSSPTTGAGAPAEGGGTTAPGGAPPGGGAVTPGGTPGSTGTPGR